MLSVYFDLFFLFKIKWLVDNLILEGENIGFNLRFEIIKI